MSDIDKIIKSSIDGYEAPFDPQAWERLSSQLNPFEDVIRESVEDYEAPYSEEAWTNVNKQLGPNKPLIGWLIGSAAVLGIIFTTIAILPEDEASTLTVNQPENIDVISNVDTKENTTQTKNSIPDEIIQDDFNDPQNNSINPVNETAGTHEIKKLNPASKAPLTETLIDASSSADIFENEMESTLESKDIPDDELTEKSSDEGQVTPINYVAKFDASAMTICQDESIFFKPTKTYTNVLYVWDFGDGNYSAENYPNHNYTKAGNFNVTLAIKDSKTNRDLATYSSSIVVKSKPEVDFTWEKSMDIIPIVKFINLTKETKYVAWKIQSKMCSDQNQFEHNFTQKGLHNIELLAEAENGCQNKVSKQINIEDDYNLLAPTAFSPNGDNTNDYFIPKALKILDREFTMTIYNQTGKLIFQTSSISHPWDGRIAIDNNEAAPGAYVWVVELRNANDQLEQYTGQVILTK